VPAPATYSPTATTLPTASNDHRIGTVRTDDTRQIFSNDTAPLHSQTQSNLAPTSEFIRLLLLAFPTRYIARALTSFISPKHKGPQQMLYGLAMGAGSTFLTLQYGALVKNDIKNLFSEAVALEKDASADQIGYREIATSQNTIVQSTLKTFHQRMLKRLGSDALFFLTAPLTMLNKGPLQYDDAKTAVTDSVVGLKGLMAISETWNRKTTMFEDLVTFVNNKINPRNGLGQPIGMGELFDLYQHYAEVHQPDKMFRNVLSQDTSQSQLNAINAPIFTRMAELMNLTYAYKHGNVASDAVAQANFALPKFIYLLGHDLIDPTRPERTLAFIEVMNAYGAAEVQQVKAQMDAGMHPSTAIAPLGLRLNHAPDPALAGTTNKTSNGVIPKGSTVQLERAEASAQKPIPHIQQEGAMLDRMHVQERALTPL